MKSLTIQSSKNENHIQTEQRDLDLECHGMAWNGIKCFERLTKSKSWILLERARFFR